VTEQQAAGGGQGASFEEALSRLEAIVQALEELDLPLINDPSAPRTVAEKTRLEQALLEEDATDVARVLIEPETPMSSRDPIRMYLSQMGNIPLLSREDEIFLAKQIEITNRLSQPRPFTTALRSKISRARIAGTKPWAKWPSLS